MAQNFFINWITSPGILIEEFEKKSIRIDLKIQTNIPGTPTFEVVSGIVPTLFYSSGRIEGELQEVNFDTLFEFTVRVKVGNSDIFSDRIFAILVKKVKKPPEWLIENNDLGNITENTLVDIDLLINPNTVLPINFTTINLPAGLQLIGNKIYGYLNPTLNQSGEGSFRVIATSGFGSSEIIFYYNFIKQRTPPVWITPSNLGIIKQGQSVNIQLFAQNNVGDRITYKMPYGQGAQLVSVLDSDIGEIKSVLVLDPGKDWSSTPTPNVKFYMGGGAIFQPVISGGGVTAINVLNGGSNFKSQPNIIISGGGGSGAYYVPQMQNGTISSLILVSSGSGYSSLPTVTVQTETTQAVATPKIVEGHVVGLEFSNKGSGYLYPPTVLVESPDPPIGGGSLPLGLKLTEDGKIVGSVSFEAEPRVYNFLVHCSDGYNLPVEKVFQLTVTPFDASSTQNVFFFWNPLEEYLGSIYERYPSYFFFEATTNSGNQVEYSLAPGSNPLPPGLTISKYTGDLLGWVDKVSNTTEYTFTIRANIVGNPLIFSDKTYKIKVLKRFGSADTQNYWLKYTGTDKLEILNKKLNDPSILDILYRKANPDFGFVLDKRILIVGGIKKKNSNEIFNLIKRKINNNNYSSYHRPFEFVIGNLNFKRVFNPDGNHICDSVYCSIYDNQEIQGKRFFGPGGWTDDSTTFVLMNNPNHPYNQSLPSTISNIRKDFLVNFEKSEKEYFPWSIVNDEKYGLIMEICFVKKNSGFLFIKQFQNFWNSEFLGKTIILDRYLVTDYMNKNQMIYNFDVDPHHSGY